MVRCRCGALLVDQLTDEGVKPVGGEPIRFRRTTDYLVCDACHSMYRVSDLHEGRSVDDSFVGTQADDESLVEALERLFDRGVDAGGDDD